MFIYLGMEFILVANWMFINNSFGYFFFTLITNYLTLGNQRPLQKTLVFVACNHKNTFSSKVKQLCGFKTNTSRAHTFIQFILYFY